MPIFSNEFMEVYCWLNEKIHGNVIINLIALLIMLIGIIMNLVMENIHMIICFHMDIIGMLQLYAPYPA
jgi:hypothetical protein